MGPTTVIGRLALSLAALKGWRRALVALLLGAVTALAMAPFHAVPALIVGFCGLYWMLGRASAAGAAWVGWCFGFGSFVAGFYWVGNAFAVAGVMPWMAPFAVLALAALAALFPAAAVLVAHFAGKGDLGGRVGIVALAASWTLGEWLRGFLVLGGFPWNFTGYAWMGSDVMIQSAALFGVHGLGFVTVLAATAPAALWPITGVRVSRRVWPLALGAALLIAIGVGGAWRLAVAPPIVFHDQVLLKIVQANIAQHHKWRDDLRAEHFERYLDMSAPSEPNSGITHVIWPETAVPYLITRRPDVRERLADLVPPGGTLITGAVRLDVDANGDRTIWNSLHAIDQEARIVASYDKSRLVPFGEYVPFRWLLGAAKLTVGTLDYSPGPGPRTLRVAGLPPFSPLICFEAIFPGRVIDPDDPPQWLLNITNDAWYGRSTGPYQHLAQVRLRAVETGLPVVRAANTGISVVTDPYGRVRASLALGEAGSLEVPLPKALEDVPLYRKIGDRPVMIALGLLLLVILGSRMGARYGHRRR